VRPPYASQIVHYCLNLQRLQSPDRDDGVIREPFTVDDVLQKCPSHFENGGADDLFIYLLSGM